MSFAFHAYQSELYPTRIRGTAVGFVYSWSRLSTVLSAFVIAFFLGRFGTDGVFALIAAAMVVVALVIGVMGPRTSNRSLRKISVIFWPPTTTIKSYVAAREFRWVFSGVGSI